MKGLSPIKAVYINIQRAHIAKLWSVVVDDHLFKAKMWTSSYDEAVDSGIADGAPKSDGVVCHPGYDLTTCIKIKPDCTVEVYITSPEDGGIFMLDSHVPGPPSLQVVEDRYTPECGREVIYEVSITTARCTYRADKHDPNDLDKCLLNMRACLQPLICSTTIMDLTRMSVVEGMVTSISAYLELFDIDTVCLASVELPEIAVELAKLGVARVVVLSRSVATLDDYWHLLLGSQMSFVPYIECTTHRCTYIHVTTIDINQIQDLSGAVWVGFDGGTVQHYAYTGHRYRMSYGLSTPDDKPMTVDVPRSLGSPSVTLGTTIKSKSHSHRGPIVGKLVITSLGLKVVQSI